MKAFEQYADFYDSYYANKNYDKEIDYILNLASQHGLSNPQTILDIGCGTAGHLLPLCKKNIKTDGFDLSEKMIELAKQKIAKSGIENFVKVETGDATTYRNGKKYGMVISMFAVMGYLTTNESFLAGLKTARTHLNKDGLFIFDVWFGPAVLHNLPETRIQEFELNREKIIRLVRSDINIIEHFVEVEYDIFSGNNKHYEQKVKESHKMRYFFVQELKYFLESTGFVLLSTFPFLKTNVQPTLNDWNISVVAKAI